MKKKLNLNPVAWIPSSTTEPLGYKSSLYFFFCSHLTAQTQLRFETLMWRRVCAISSFTQTGCKWAHISPSFHGSQMSCFPELHDLCHQTCLSVSEWENSEVDVGRGAAGDDPAEPQSGCLHTNPALLEWGGDSLRCHQGAATSPSNQQRWEKRHWIYRRGQFLLWVQPEQLKV